MGDTTTVAPSPQEDGEEKKCTEVTFSTKDRPEVVALLTLQQPFQRVETGIDPDTNKTVKFFHFTGTKALSIIEDFRHGKALPVPDIRMVFMAEETFKKALKTP